MKFKNIGNAEMAGVYGYRFRPGEVVDVKEENLIAKFVNYGWLEQVDGAEKAAPAKQEVEADPLDRDALKAKADELGIDYFPRIKTEALAKLVEEHGSH